MIRTSATRQTVVAGMALEGAAAVAVLAVSSMALEPVHGGLLRTAVAGGAALCAGILVAMTAKGGGREVFPGLAALAVCVVLGPSITNPGAALVSALLAGLGAGPVARGAVRSAGPGRAAAAGGVAGLVLLLCRWLFGPGVVVAVAIAVIAGAAAGLRGAVLPPGGGRRRAVAAVSALAVASLFAVFWVGSTSPAAAWFGPLESHGPRNLDQVAITFDDGPNPDSLRIAAILRDYGIHATFFEVGKALVQRPDIAAALMADGNVVANHSYSHDAVGYLHPAYPELGRTQDAFARTLGVCPALFRPPHGTHTPFMSFVVRHHGMRLVTWDVSAADWVESDPERLARNILAKVRPGSIILLHDGIDGDLVSDRSVVVDALPLIIQGLRERGLEPVTLDQLLGVPAYLPAGRC